MKRYTADDSTKVSRLSGADCPMLDGWYGKFMAQIAEFSHFVCQEAMARRLLQWE
jgi:hypothetical protein